MAYVFKCEGCDRPAPVISVKRERTFNDYSIVKKIVANKCICGGVIKPTLE